MCDYEDMHEALCINLELQQTVVEQMSKQVMTLALTKVNVYIGTTHERSVNALRIVKQKQKKNTCLSDICKYAPKLYISFVKDVLHHIVWMWMTNSNFVVAVDEKVVNT